MAKKFQVVTRSTPMRDEPDPFGILTSEILYGETVETISHHGDFLKCRNLQDGYEGFVIKAALSDEILEATHKIIRLHSFIYSEPDFKTLTITYLSFLSHVTLTGAEENGFAEIIGGGWIWADDIAPLNHQSKNHLKTAQMFLNLPYLWGGKSSRGIDCSGLTQLSLQHAGILDCPRDSIDQEKARFGKKVEFGDPENPDKLKSGDLVFLKGHVGIMVDESNILNATSRTMDVRIEPLHEITAYYEGGVKSVRRLT